MAKGAAGLTSRSLLSQIILESRANSLINPGSALFHSAPGERPTVEELASGLEWEQPPHLLLLLTDADPSAIDTLEKGVSLLVASPTEVTAPPVEPAVRPTALNLNAIRPKSVSGEEVPRCLCRC